MGPLPNFKPLGEIRILLKNGNRHFFIAYPAAQLSWKFQKNNEQKSVKTAFGGKIGPNFKPLA